MSFLSGSVSLTPIFVVAGVGILATVYEKVVGKEGGSAQILQTVAVLVGFGVVLFLLTDITNEVVTTFMNMR